MRLAHFAAILITVVSSSALLADSASDLYRVNAESPQGLRELFRYDGQAIPLVSAHRGGAAAGFPENCIETFEHTLSHTYSILEIDLRRTRDGHFVLHHDATLERTTTGSGRVDSATLRELKQLRLKDPEGNVTDYRIPTLAEALDWARGKTIVILDKKDVPVQECVKMIQTHRAQSYAMVMAYSFDDIRECYRLDPDIMMEVMIGNQERVDGFDASGVPWSRVIAFVGHQPDQSKDLLQMIHSRGVSCMAGTSRNLDREFDAGDPDTKVRLRKAYRERLDFGIDLLETDRPIDVAALVYRSSEVPASKSNYFRHPSR